ncbi:hypothetical protein FRC11_003470 [Ceratobasidium sp. 423]|nr:hypothetical protein FRC11_003470 [Ceratobasidium sp. 423]
MPKGVCRYFSRPGGCIHGDFCRFQHIFDAGTPPEKSPEKDDPTNNQNPPPDDASTTTFTYPRDARYYQPDGSGTFLVEGVLFKATAIFGSRPEVAPGSNRKFVPAYIEDILPIISHSGDTSPIEIRGITKKQFQTYLLLITGLPYSDDYLPLLVDYLTPEKHTQDLFLRYLDIATVAPRLGMTKLEAWAMNALHIVFTESANSFRRIPYDWKYSTLVQLRELTRETNLDLPVRAFIQYLIHRIVQDIRHNQGASGCSSKIADLIEIYQGFKKSGDDDALLGCVFLNILSLGHRSQVWSDLTRDDKAILYAAQAQLTSLPEEFVPGSLAWVTKPDPGLAQQLCDACQLRLSGVWDKIFSECNEGLGSNIPLKDVLFLAEMPEYRWTLWNEMSQAAPVVCTLSPLVPPSSPATSNTSRPITCPIRPLLNDVDQHIRDVYEQAASRYRAIAK